MRFDGWLSTRVIADELNLDKGIVRKILIEDLEMRKISAKDGTENFD